MRLLYFRETFSWETFVRDFLVELAGLGWTGAELGWTGLGWAALGWIGLGWTGLDGAGLDWAGLGWTRA